MRELLKKLHIEGTEWEADKENVYCDDPTGQRICHCGGKYLFLTKEEQEAHARLLAASKDLLAVALMVSKSITHCNLRGEVTQINEDEIDWFMLDDAILKATGKDSVELLELLGDEEIYE